MTAMRVWPLVLGLVGGCVTPSDPYPPDYGTNDPGWGSGTGGSGGSTGYGCHADPDCGTQVCARDGECLAASQVRIVHVTWTLHGGMPSTATCATVPDLELTFANNLGESFGFAPVPCVEGKFTIDKMPTRFTTAALERQYDYNTGVPTAFDATGTAALDLPY